MPQHLAGMTVEPCEELYGDCIERIRAMGHLGVVRQCSDACLSHDAYFYPGDLAEKVSSSSSGNVSSAISSS